MHKSTIDETLEAIENVSKKAAQSKEYTIQFLFDAGIINEKEYKQKLKLFAKEKLN
jgi:hypothetical protein